MCVFDTQKNNPKNPYNNYGTGSKAGSLSKAVYREGPNFHETSGVFNRQKPENISQKYRNDPRKGLNVFHQYQLNATKKRMFNFSQGGLCNEQNKRI